MWPFTNHCDEERRAQDMATVDNLMDYVNHVREETGAKEVRIKLDDDTEVIAF